MYTEKKNYVYKICQKKQNQVQNQLELSLSQNLSKYRRKKESKDELAKGKSSYTKRKSNLFVIRKEYVVFRLQLVLM